MSNTRLGSKELRTLARRFRKGYRIHSTGENKFCILDSEGVLVRTDDGQPITLANSPTTDHHYMRRVTSQLRKAGVIE